MQIQKVIERLGFSPKEAKVYLTVLQLGEAHVSDIAKRVKIPNSSTQIIINRLHKEGLMNFYVRHRYKYWTAEKPERLLTILQEHETELQSILPRLSTFRLKNSDVPAVKIFKGADEIKLVHDDILATKHPIQALICWDNWMNLLGEEYMEDFMERRAKHFLKIDLLVHKTESSLRLIEKDAKQLRHTRFLPARIKVTTSNFIYGNKLAIISLNKKEPTAIIIEDPEVASTSSSIFEEMWNLSGS